MRIELKNKMTAGSVDITLDSSGIMDSELVNILRHLKKYNPNLERLSLCNNQITDVGVQMLISQLTSFDRLTFVDLQSNKIDKPGFSAILNFSEMNSQVQFALANNVCRDPSYAKQYKRGLH